jgi:hypothetical protein
MRQEEVGEPPETESMQRCVFCEIEPDPGSVVLQSDHFSITKDKFPVSPGHLLIIPRRHITSPSDLNETEWNRLRDVLEDVGDWGMPYAARFEVWFAPESGGADRKLLEKVFKIEGWQK